VKWKAVGFLVVVVAFAVGVLAGYKADHHRAAPTSEMNPALVLVAKRHIPKGTPGLLVLSHSMYAPTTVPQQLAEADAIPDPRYLKGRAAVVEMFPGQQFTETNFTASG